MQEPTNIKYIRDVIVFPFTITVIIPYLLYNKNQHLIPDTIIVKIAAAVFFIIGLTLFFSTNYLFKTIAKGTLAPWSPKQNLVMQGPYRYCRNPMITGVLCLLLAEALYLHCTNILIFFGIFIITNTIFFIKVEEPYLTKTFGSQYLLYKKNVPRWIPRWTPYKVKAA